MNSYLLNHYCQFGTFTNSGAYKEYLRKLPDNVQKIGELVGHQIIHRVTLKDGNTRDNRDLRYGDMKEYPWYRLRCEDDVLPTAVSMIAELFRLDNRGFVPDRKVEHKLVVTCRFVAVLMASILKSKGIPCRVRSGFAPYFYRNQSWDHWINQYWSEKEQRWITFDADGFFDHLSFDQYDIPPDEFDWAASGWLGIRQGREEAEKFYNAGGYHGLMPVLWAVFYDFHSLMNNEILYLQSPSYISNKFETLTEEDFQEIDQLAQLMLNPDGNFDELLDIWHNKKKFRILNGPLISDRDHL